MEANFTLQIKTFSINKKHCRDSRHTTRDYKDWEAQLCYKLDKSEPKSELERLRKHFNPKEHVYSLELTATYPQEILFTKKNLPSAKCHDITNWEKPLQDVLFEPKYFGKSVPYGCQNLNIDDKYVFNVSSKKRLGPHYSIHVKIKILNIQDIFDEYHQSTEQSLNDDNSELLAPLDT